MFVIFQPLYLQQLGATPVLIGTILGISGIMMALAQIPAGFIADRIGPRPLMFASWVFGTIATLLMAFAPSLPWFVAAMLFFGLTSFVIAPMNAYIVSKRGKFSVERVLTLVSAMYQIGAVIGPILGGALGTRFGLQAVYRYSAVIFFVSTGIIFFIHKQDEVIHENLHLKGNLLRNPRFLAVLPVFFFTMFALYLPQPLTANFLQNQHSLALEQIGQLSAVGNLGNAIVSLALGSLNAGAGFLIGQAFMIVFTLMLWRGGSFPFYMLGYFFLGGYRLCRSMSLAFVRSLVHPADTGLAFGMVETVNALTIILAPPLAGWLYSQNPLWIFTLSLGMTILFLGVNVFLLPWIRRSPPPYKSSKEFSNDA